VPGRPPESLGAGLVIAAAVGFVLSRKRRHD
jgi:LPXTG-motif cell wall-anchored protein